MPITFKVKIPHHQNEQRINDIEASARKYNLLVKGLPAEERLERPYHLEALLTRFFHEVLGLDNTEFDEAERINESSQIIKALLLEVHMKYRETSVVKTKLVWCYSSVKLIYVRSLFRMNLTSSGLLTGVLSMELIKVI